ncbi:MAG TPA: A24 family peptidase C-terminal domain-containing protein [Thermoplasmata archaeon]|nr:A24 family peptidase C-terminal domain-containing protein [Thermoplasmata archaeon]
MTPQEGLAVLQLAVATAILGYASVLDLRTRRVSNASWIALSVIGVAILPIRVVIDEAPVEFLLIMIPILAILSDVFLDSDGDSALSRYSPLLKYGVAVVATVALGMTWADDEYFRHLLAIPIVMIVVVVLYMLDMIRGGADAKALIALAVLFPVYPMIAGLPLIAGSEALQTFFPFALAVLVNAAILVVFLPIVFLVMNLARGDLKFPQIFVGYRMPIDVIADEHVWLMERIVNGSHVFYTRPKVEEDLKLELARLSERGVSRVWVTPKIPFIVPMLAGLILTAVVGNFLFLFFSF